MKIVEINTLSYGSTGKIMDGIAKAARAEGHRVYTFSRNWESSNPPEIDHGFIGSRLDNFMHQKLGVLTGYEGCFSRFATQRLLKRLDEINPDIIHLHNLHGWYIHLSTLFNYIKARNARVVWTLHDCWSFTGKCPHFVVEKCERWKSGCHHCPQQMSYPRSWCDRSTAMYKNKKNWFGNVENMTIVTPSKWLACMAGQSFLKDYPVRVINNGIDLSIFKPTQSDFLEKYHCQEKNILLGVSFGWGYKKGLDVFVELSKRLPSNYQIVLVGTNEEVDKTLPKNIISIHRTQNQNELAEIYSAADVFINPTREDTYPTVNMEAIACGTPVISFESGGSPEILDEMTGVVVPFDDIDALERECIRVCEEKVYSRSACVAKAKDFDMNIRYREYVDLYGEKG